MKLKILFTNNAPLIKYGLSQGFIDLGHEVFIMDGKYQLWDKDKEEQVKLFIEAVDEIKPDVCFSECFANFAEGIFEHTKKIGLAHFFFSIEDTPHDHWIGDYWSDYADHIFTTTAECLPNYWNKGKSAELMLFGCNPKFHKKIGETTDRDIVLVANNYDRRAEQTKNFVMPLVHNNYDIHIHGNEWWIDSSKPVHLVGFETYYRGYAAYEELPKLYSSSKIIIGQNLDKSSITQTSMRPFEALGIGGGLLVAEKTPAMEYLFHDHVYLPENTDDMIQMIEEILCMTENQRRLKAKRAQQFVYKYHSYTSRAQQVVNAFVGVKI